MEAAEECQDFLRGARNCDGNLSDHSKPVNGYQKKTPKLMSSDSNPAAAVMNIGQQATLACLLEVMAPKPGNVHRGADFADLTFHDFAASAVAIAPAMENAGGRALGQTILQAIIATRAVAPTNTNLGIVLLLAPLAAAVLGDGSLREGVAAQFNSLDADDARCVYEAIRLAQPGGMGRAEQMDLADAPPANLLTAMQSAAGRDAIARQYTNGLADIFDFVAPRLQAENTAGHRLSEAIVSVHLQTLSEFPDTLIARKCGSAAAADVSVRAAAVLDVRKTDDQAYWAAVADFDFWLRSDGHRRNPGATADMICAGLFVGLLEGWLAPPFR